MPISSPSSDLSLYFSNLYTHYSNRLFEMSSAQAGGASHDDQQQHNEPLLCITFTQDSKCFSVGHAQGYILYSTQDILDSQTLQSEAENSPNFRSAILVERMFASSLVIIVSQQEPRSMHVYHFQSRNVIIDVKFGNTILNVKVNRERVIACLEDSIYIYNLKDMRLLHTIVDTPLNKTGLIDLSAAPGTALVAYPGSSDAGTLHIFDAINLCSVNTFIAHDGPLAALKFNPDGTMLATASIKGTVIRVYSVPQGTRLFEFRRGMTRCVTIYSLAFSPDSSFLCSSSNTETVHVFKLEKADDEKHKQEQQQESTASSWFGSIMQTASSYLPTQVNELITVERSFATARLPGTESKKNIAALTNLKSQLHLLVATTDGYLYCYRVDTNAPSGGELDLVKQHRIGPGVDGARAGFDTNAGRSRGGTGSGGSQGTGDSGATPNVDDPDDFPPMSHASG